MVTNSKEYYEYYKKTYGRILLKKETIELLKRTGHMTETYDTLIQRLINERKEK